MSFRMLSGYKSHEGREQNNKKKMSFSAHQLRVSRLVTEAMKATLANHERPRRKRRCPWGLPDPLKTRCPMTIISCRPAHQRPIHRALLLLLPPPPLLNMTAPLNDRYHSQA